MSDLVGNHIVGFPTRRPILFVISIYIISVVCAAAEKLVYVCVEDYNKTIVNFRSHDFCSKYC